MRLKIRFNDFPCACADLENTGYMPPLNYRFVDIELTPEQEEKLKPRELGKNCGRPTYEIREILGLED